MFNIDFRLYQSEIAVDVRMSAYLDDVLFLLCKQIPSIEHYLHQLYRHYLIWSSHVFDTNETDCGSDLRAIRPLVIRIMEPSMKDAFYREKK